MTLPTPITLQPGEDLIVSARAIWNSSPYWFQLRWIYVSVF